MARAIHDGLAEGGFSALSIHKVAATLLAVSLSTGGAPMFHPPISRDGQMSGSSIPQHDRGGGLSATAALRVRMAPRIAGPLTPNDGA